MTKSRTEAANQAVSDILAPTGDSPHLDKAIASESRELQVSDEVMQAKTPRVRKEKKNEDPDAIENISIEDKKLFYVAVMYGEGKVTWRLPIGNEAADTMFGVAPKYVVFTSKGGAEIEVHEELLAHWRKDPEKDGHTILNLTNRADLFLHLRKYGDMEFKLPEPDETGKYSVAAMEAYMNACVRRMGLAPMATALAHMATFQRRMSNCVLSLQNGSFMKAGR